MLAGRCFTADPGFDYESLSNLESPLWQLVTARPPHLLDPRYRSWQDLFLAVADELLAHYAALGDGVPLARRTWGQANVSNIRHPLSELLPGAAWLDMPHHPMAGEYDMPHVQLPTFGATLRMVVSPGREAEGVFTMPAGQSGNPRSPHYRDSHPAWEKGETALFLPGATVETLTLHP
jgi:penicillin amidase